MDLSVETVKFSTGPELVGVQLIPVGYYPLQMLQNNFGSDPGDKPERVRGGVHS